MEGGALCKHCGAVLPMADTEGRISCLSCGRSGKARVEPPEPGSAGGATSSDSSGSMFVSWTPEPGKGAPAATRTASRSIGCLVSVAVLFLVGGIVAAFVTAGRSATDATSPEPSGGKLSVSANSVLAVRDDGLEIVAAAYDGRADVRSLARLRLGPDGADAGEVWRSEAFPPGVYGGPLALMGDTVFAALGDELWALDVETGTTRWEATLPDAVQASCDCFSVSGDTLLVRTSDAQILAYRATSSEPLWDHRLVSTTGAMLPSGAGLAVVDDSAESPSDREVRMLDLASGATLSSFSPVCQDDGGSTRGLSFTDAVYTIPDSTDLVATVSFGGGCAVRWNGATGQTVWASATGDLSSSGHRAGAVMGQRLVVPTSAGLSFIDLASGGVVVATAPADNQLDPETMVGDVSVVQSRTTRGSTRFGLAGVDASTGAILWQQALPGGGELIREGDTNGALFSGTQISHLAELEDGVRLLTFEAQGETTTVTMAALDAATGKVGERSTFDFDTGPGTPSAGVLASRDSGVLVSVDDEIVLLTADGRTFTYGG